MTHEYILFGVINLQWIALLFLAYKRGHKTAIATKAGELNLRVNLDTQDAAKELDLLTTRIDTLVQKAAEYNRRAGVPIAS